MRGVCQRVLVVLGGQVVAWVWLLPASNAAAGQVLRRGSRRPIVRLVFIQVA